MKQSEYFNQIAKNWDTMVYHDPEKIKHLLSLIHISAGSRILDVGCGTGVLIPYLRPLVGKTGQIVELDIANQMLEVAKEKYGTENVTYVCGDAVDDALDLGLFDALICYSMFPHFEHKPKALKMLAKRLKKGGYLAILHSQNREAINNLHKEQDAEEIKEARLPKIEIFTEWLTGAGLTMTATEDATELFAIIATRE